MSTASSPTAALPIIHLLSSGGFYGAERMLLDHCLATPGQHQVLFLDAPPELIQRFRAAGVDCRGCAGLGELLRHLRQRRGDKPLINTHNFKGLLFGWVSATLLRLPLVITLAGGYARDAASTAALHCLVFEEAVRLERAGAAQE